MTLNLEVVRELQEAIDHFRWCWDCGATDKSCRATTAPAGKCCPDCRHRDTGAPYLAPLFTAPADLIELHDAAQTVCATLDDAGRLHATTGGPELDALVRR